MKYKSIQISFYEPIVAYSLSCIYSALQTIALLIARPSRNSIVYSLALPPPSSISLEANLPCGDRSIVLIAPHKLLDMADPNMSNISLSRKVEAEETPSHHDGGPANLSLCQSATIGDTSKGTHEAHSNVNEQLETNESIPYEQYEAEGVGGSAMDAIDDNISIASIEMLQMEIAPVEEVQKEVQQILPSDSTFAKTRKIRDKFAKASGLYVQGLEARVRTLETQVRDIQVQTGLKKKEEDVGCVPPTRIRD